MQKQQGFTLIELIVVIIILGILAVTAAPKFIDVQKDAQVAAMKGIAGALSSTKDLVYAKAAIEGKLSLKSTQNKPVKISTLEGDVNIRYGYPRATKEGIILAVNISGMASVDSSDVQNGKAEFEYLYKYYNADNPDIIVIVPSRFGLTDSDFNKIPCRVIYAETNSLTEEAKVTSVLTGC